MDLGRAPGEIAKRADNQHVLSQDKHPATLDSLGIPRQRLHEARKLAALPEAAIAEAIVKANEEEPVIPLAELIASVVRVAKSSSVVDRLAAESAALEARHPVADTRGRLRQHHRAQSAGGSSSNAASVALCPLAR